MNIPGPFPNNAHRPHTDAPTIRLLGAPQMDLEEGKESLVLRCEADANPPASIVWRRAGRSEIASLQVNIQLNNYIRCCIVSIVIFVDTKLSHSRCLIIVIIIIMSINTLCIINDIVVIVQ